MELCVGPSLKVFEEEYEKYGIICFGNDLERRWRNYYPKGKWVIGNCLEVPTNVFDTIVFAPPLSKGCSGKREDSLAINDVVPNYFDFLTQIKDRKLYVLVLPARSLSTRQDRGQYYCLLNNVSTSFDILHIEEQKVKVRKYVELYIRRRA